MEPTKENLIRFIQDLIAIPSVNGEHGETACAERFALEARNLGLDAQLHGQDPMRQNVVVSCQLGSSEISTDPLFIFIGHLDTVSLGTVDLWKYPPLAAVWDHEEDRIYGRGAVDNKGGMACAMYTMAQLKETSGTLGIHGKILLAGVVDEESGANSHLGARYLIQNKIIGGYGAIYTEPNRNITIGHRGLLRFVVEVTGESWHTGSSQYCSGKKGANAVMALCEILTKIESYDWPLNLHESFPNLRLTVTPGTVFNGGSFESAVPDFARALIDARTMPDSDHGLIIKSIKQIVDETIDRRNQQYPQPRLSATVSVKNNLPASCIPGGANHQLPQSCLAAVKQIAGDKQIHIGACGPANEGYMLMNEASPPIPCICGFGPIGGGAHSVNEWIDVSSLMTTVDIYAFIVQDYLTKILPPR